MQEASNRSTSGQHIENIGDDDDSQRRQWLVDCTCSIVQLAYFKIK